MRGTPFIRQLSAAVGTREWTMTRKDYVVTKVLQTR